MLPLSHDHVTKCQRPQDLRTSPPNSPLFFNDDVSMTASSNEVPRPSSSLLQSGVRKTLPAFFLRLLSIGLQSVLRRLDERASRRRRASTSSQPFRTSFCGMGGKERGKSNFISPSRSLNLQSWLFCRRLFPFSLSPSLECVNQI